MNLSSTAKERVECGLDAISTERTVTVSLRDLMYVHQALAEFVQFFHQPNHYPNPQDIKDFLGVSGSGEAYDVLHESLYHRIGNMIPEDISIAFDSGEFDQPKPPRYFKENTSEA